jgi:hypothetical protein
MTALAQSTTPVQLEACESTRPVGESLIQSIGGVANYALANSGQLGDVVYSMLNQTQFQAQRDSSWVLAEGQNIATSDLGVLLGITYAPDLRGVYIRGASNGSVVDPNAPQTPTSQLGVGVYVADQVVAHTHTTVAVGSGTLGFSSTANNGIADSHSTITSSAYPASGGAETAPKTVYMNGFIKINNTNAS